MPFGTTVPESAPLVADRRTLGSTILFQARKHDRPMPFVAPPWVRKFKADDFKLRPFGKPGSDLGLEYGYWWAEWGGCLDTIKDNERIRDELLAITLGVWNHVKNESGLDVANWALEWFGFLPGKRESRRFVGQHVLTEGNVFHSEVFADAIAYGGWPIDTHPPEGVDAPELPPCEQHHLPYLYDIPLRACVSAGPGNLMFAGRDISATHIAFASTRVMATCAVIGQGVGTAAALAVRAGVAPVAVAARPDLCRAIQQQLVLDDCYLVGVRNEDPADLVRTAASVSASSGQAGADAEQIRSGQTRAIHGRPGQKTADLSSNLWDDVIRETETGQAPAEQITCAPPDRAFAGLHRWMSDPAQGLPAWIELRWPDAVRVVRVQLIFDTGLHRHLTLTQADGFAASMLWGRAQPETVRDYVVEAQTGGTWREIVAVKNNYQRRRVHRLDQPLEITALRVRVMATNGIDHARIMEIRAYA